MPMVGHTVLWLTKRRGGRAPGPRPAKRERDAATAEAGDRVAVGGDRQVGAEPRAGARQRVRARGDHRAPGWRLAHELAVRAARVDDVVEKRHVAGGIDPNARAVAVAHRLGHAECAAGAPRRDRGDKRAGRHRVLPRHGRAAARVDRHVKVADAHRRRAQLLGCRPVSARRPNRDVDLALPAGQRLHPGGGGEPVGRDCGVSVGCVHRGRREHVVFGSQSARGRARGNDA